MIDCIAGAMRVYDFDQSENPPGTEKLERRSVESEWQLESWLFANPEVILDERLLIFGRQYGLDSGYPDLLALDRWGNVVVIELKKGQSGLGSASEGSILSQPQEYAQSLSNYEYDDLETIYDELKTKVRNDEWHPGESGVIEESLVEAHDSAFGTNIDEADFNQRQRMIILAERITSQTESNASYLLEHGLNVQCVSVQLFVRPAGDENTESEYAVLGSATVVDYPRSQVQPEDNTVDYSQLHLDVRDQVYPRIKEDLQLEERNEIAKPTHKQAIGFGSNHPGHPSPLKYGMEPLIEEKGKINFRVNLWNTSSDQHTELRQFLAAQLDEMDGYTLAENPDRSMGVISKEMEVDRGGFTPSELAQELVDLVQFLHPRAIEEYADDERFH